MVAGCLVAGGTSFAILEDGKRSEFTIYMDGGVPQYLSRIPLVPLAESHLQM
jgi:hypothetical protein